MLMNTPASEFDELRIVPFVSEGIPNAGFDSTGAATG
jgi:hypothetical protein